MNHYERLKVSQDAPAEVIRAAYRALAAKLHPDRQGRDTGPDDAMHTQMASLNSAYEVLIDPKLRREYDATLAPTRPAMALNSEAPFEPSDQMSPRVDMDWLTPTVNTTPTLWPPTQRVMIIGGCGLAVFILALTGVLWREAGQHKMERAFSDQYATHPSDTQAPLSPDEPMASTNRSSALSEVPQGQAGKRRPTVDELAKMSDEELLKVLPTLEGEAPGSTAAAAPALSRPKRGGNVHHPLDGKPLSLRVDTKLVDPLAPPPTPRRP